LHPSHFFAVPHWSRRLVAPTCRAEALRRRKRCEGGSNAKAEQSQSRSPLKILHSNRNLRDRQCGRYVCTLLRPGTAALRLRAPRALWSAATGRRFFAKARRAQAPWKLGDISPSFWNSHRNRVFPRRQRGRRIKVNQGESSPIKVEKIPGNPNAITAKAAKSQSGKLPVLRSTAEAGGFTALQKPATWQSNRGESC